MKVKLLSITENPIDLIYEGYRICYAKNLDSIDLKRIKTTEDKINWLLNFLSNGHETPLEHVNMTFEIEGVSRSLLAQLTRHRVGFSFNVQSQRYVNANNFGSVLPKEVEKYPKAKKYAEEKIVEIFSAYNELYNMLLDKYVTHDGLNEGIAKKLANENARCLLPNACTCNLMVTCNLRALRHFLSLRLCNHAQEEIRELAHEFVELVKPYIPFVDKDVMNCGKTCFQCINK